MSNVIKQIVKTGEYGAQTIKMIVKDAERGPQGEQGEQGDAATIAAGAAYAVEPDENPAVINTGTSSAAVFDFYIPKGQKGDPGADGRDGEPGRDGAIQYTAGSGIVITDQNVIEATGATSVTWGHINGTLSDQTDLQTALNAKQGTLTAGSNISISGSTISATDTTYSNFTGTDGVDAGAAGLVPAPATTDSGKFLNANGTWQNTVSANDATLTITNNGTSMGTFTANASVDTTIALSAPVITMSATDPGEGVALAANNFIAVYTA